MGGNLARAARWLVPVIACAVAGQARAEDASLPPGAPSDLPPERVARVKIDPAPETDGRPFQMGLEYAQIWLEEGGLAHPGQGARVVGLRFLFREGRSIRQHFAIAHQWEREGAIVRQGFRFDLLALGFPIPVWDRPSSFRLEIEPLLRPVRGQIMFESTGNGQTRSLVRFESGFAFDVRLTKGAWFFCLEPVGVDFRTVVATRDSTSAGFSRIWSTALSIGRDF